MESKIEIDLLTVLESIDKYFELQAKNLSRLVTDGEALPKDSLFEFDSCVPIESCEEQFEFQDGKKHPGVYVFQITSLVTINPSKGKFNSPVSNAARLKAKYAKRKYFDVHDIVYLGKDETNVVTRINQHVAPGNNTTTSSLRLNDPNRRHLYGKLQVYVFVLKGEYKKYAKTIVSSVERHLHNQLNPMVGTIR